MPKINFKLLKIPKIINSYLYFEIYIIGDIYPLSWHRNHKKLKKYDDFFDININFKKKDILKYKYFIRTIDDNGNEIHFIENNFRILKLENDAIIENKFNDYFKFNFSKLYTLPICENLFISPIITSNGEISFCCNDYYGKANIGNIKNNTLSKVWNSNKLNFLRLNHIRGNRKTPYFCYQCLNPQPASDTIVINFLKLIGLSHIYPEYKAKIQNKEYFPLYLQIELTDICQLQCDFCNQKYNNWEKVHGISKKGFIKKELLKKIINDLNNLDFPIKLISLFWLGEPLLHPEFKEFINIINTFYQKKEFYQEIEIHTNLISLSPDIINFLIKNSPKNFILTLSIDSLKKNTYEKMRGPYFEKMIFNLKYLLKQKRPFKTVYQFIITKANINELENIYNFFRNNLNDFQITAWHDWIKTDILYFRYCDPLKIEDEKNNTELFQKAIKFVKEKPEHKVMFYPEYYLPESIKPNKNFIYPCPLIFENPTIRWDGELTTCCHDTEMINKIGNINTHSFKYLWFENEKLNKMRKNMILNKDISEFCRKCTFKKSQNNHTINEYYLFRFIKKYLNSNLIKKYLNLKLKNL